MRYVAMTVLWTLIGVALTGLMLVAGHYGSQFMIEHAHRMHPQAFWGGVMIMLIVLTVLCVCAVGAFLEVRGHCLDYLDMRDRTYRHRMRKRMGHASLHRR